MASVRRKLKANLREIFEVHRHQANPSTVETLHVQGEAALRVLRWLKNLPKVGNSGVKYYAVVSRAGMRAMWDGLHNHQKIRCSTRDAHVNETCSAAVVRTSSWKWG